MAAETGSKLLQSSFLHMSDSKACKGKVPKSMSMFSEPPSIPDVSLPTATPEATGWPL